MIRNSGTKSMFPENTRLQKHKIERNSMMSLILKRNLTKIKERHNHHQLVNQI